MAALFGVILVALAAIDRYEELGVVAFAVALFVVFLIGPFYLVLVERASTGFKRLRPLYCSMYELESFQIERHWKLSWQPAIFNATPLKSVFWRLTGVRLGKRVFDDGALIMDKTMVAIGDDCVLNAGTVIQPHSQEGRSLQVRLHNHRRKVHHRSRRSRPLRRHHA